ncbi:LysE family transporter [Candidatus Neptunochlamydia vexilliferae]|uniref:Uncharacterized protein n=1 Tax=Candidatus Neptunichlamydia vexilliferae TaxID=1651774 RepID=A0ABS0AXE7_9BACT|nr:LysE family transporter [Candidatus Neptunochlamydia vexilliferae]MBF5058803.1 hypothetical protein [Candidatus Neptunochlamydia vexilliferae]
MLKQSTEETIFFLLGLSYLLAVISPGPSLAVIAKNSLSISSRAGFLTAVGTTCGIAFQAFYSLAGLSFLQNSPRLLSILNVLLGIYLIYLSIKFLFLEKKAKRAPDTSKEKNRSLSYFHHIKEGFLVDVLNPLALVFFLAIFSSYTNPNDPTFLKFAYWIEIVVIGFLWFGGVSLLLSHSKLRNILVLKLRKPMMIIMSSVLFLLGIKLTISCF